MVKQEIQKASEVALIRVRGTHFREELAFLAPYLKGLTKPVFIVVTYEDKMTVQSKNLLKKQILTLKIPLFLLDTRRASEMQLNHFYACIDGGQAVLQQPRSITY